MDIIIKGKDALVLVPEAFIDSGLVIEIEGDGAEVEIVPTPEVEQSFVDVDFVTIEEDDSAPEKTERETLLDLLHSMKARAMFPYTIECAPARYRVGDSDVILREGDPPHKQVTFFFDIQGALRNAAIG